MSNIAKLLNRSQNLFEVVFKFLLSALAPTVCAICLKPPSSLCVDCEAKLLRNLAFRSASISGKSFRYAFKYRGEYRDLIIRFKQHGENETAKFLGLVFAIQMQELVSKNPQAIVIAIPPTGNSMRARGFWPMMLVARQAGIKLCKGLKWVRKVKAQHTLSLQERAGNRKGALSARHSLRGEKVILVDDVITSGATIFDAERAISTAGGEVVGIVALAFAKKNTPLKNFDETFSELR